MIENLQGKYQGFSTFHPLWDMTRDWMPKRASVVKPEAV
jgi:hypothetical protein